MRMPMKSMLLAVVAASVLSAQSKPTCEPQPLSFSAFLDAGQAADGLKKVTYAPLSFHGGFSATMGLPDTASLGRLTLQAGSMPGKTHGLAKSDLKLFQLAIDILLDMPNPNLHLIVGLSASRYRVTNTGTETWIPETSKDQIGKAAPVDVFAVTHADGLKGGLRLGLEYRFLRNLSGELLFQLTELSGGVTRTIPDPNDPKKTLQAPNNGPVNPAWFQAGLRYHF